MILAGVRSGRLDSHHLVDRASRTKPLLVAVAAVLVALLLLIFLGAPRLLVATVTAMLAALAVTIPITLRWKISFHAAVSAGTVLVLAQVLPAVPTLGVGALIVATVCWARVRLTHHTPGPGRRRGPHRRRYGLGGPERLRPLTGATGHLAIIDRSISPGL